MVENLTKKIISLFLVASVMVTMLAVFPVSVKAVDFQEGQEYTAADGEVFVVDNINNEYWVVSNSLWHSCIYNDDKELTNLIADIQQAMYKRQDKYSAYFIVKDKYVSPDGNSDSEDVYKRYLTDLFNTICEDVYNDSVSPYGSDYLEHLTLGITLGSESGYVTASSKSDEYSFYRIELSFEYSTTAHQEEQVNEFLQEWNEYYIENNKKISSSTGSEREYYIVKTIYNYLTKNTVYDIDVYNDRFNNEQYPADSVRYKVSHSAFGALFGNIEGCYDDNFQYKTFSHYEEKTNSNVYDYKVNLAYASANGDNQGLYRIGTLNQGRSVCDGYVLAFYYLCKLNGIDAKIVLGDYTDDSEKGNDPHAWNMVRLKDYQDSDYEWYYVDATFGSQRTQKISDDFTVTDYAFFLRGTENADFSKEKHQQVFDKADLANASVNDYRFKLNNVDVKNAYAVVTRRRLEDKSTKYVSDGVYNLENYIIIDTDGKLKRVRKYKVTDSGEVEVSEDEYNPEDKYIYKYSYITDGFAYYGANDGYWYSFELYDFAEGIEYVCKDRKLKNAGSYDFEIADPNNNFIANRSITISPCYMGDESKYDLYYNIVGDGFAGGSLQFSTEIFDTSKTLLEENRDYALYFYKAGDEEHKKVEFRNPGDYIIRIDYFGNYSGFIEIPVTIEKIDISILELGNKEFTYGKNILSSFDSFKLGDTTLYEGKDYSVNVVGGFDYMDSGVVQLIGLKDSAYLKEGSIAAVNYIINGRMNASPLFDGKKIANLKYTYTGKQIKPDNFTVACVIDGKKVNLVKNVDYRILGYGKNIDCGSGTIKVEFIGKFSGSATMSFDIASPANFSVTVPDLVYNGKNQSPSPKVSYNGAVLKKGVDYTVSGSAKTPGVYICTVKGIGNFANISGKYTYFVNPAKVSGLKKVSASASNIKLSWTAQGGATGYQIDVYDTAKKAWYKIGQTSSNSFNVSAVFLKGKKSALKGASNYQFRVRAFFTANSGKIARYSAYSSINVYTLPKTPAIKKLTKSKTALKVTWNKDSSVNGYQIVLATNSKFTKGKKSATIKKNKTTSYTFKKLKKGKIYYVRIRSYKKVGSTTYYSAYSKTVKVKL
ncbi:MAG: fibronectin type III domain-containing protein [Acetobacter sp.]|nr:fibronectin type III domain-containing protein [Bacteroides sp.]MCM1341906.1 fibronectin type III domain-containing protein [Acetobacter sp.]MCM1434090.1 fibronectin type III domain-containing protein [Clostridiales bacterium]